MGSIQLARIEPQSAAYIAGYVTKKLRAKPLPPGLHKEFTRMSLKPGLGYGATADIASILLQYDLHKTVDDVPTVLSHGTAKLPLGKYLRRHIRKQIGRDEKCPEIIMEKMATEMQDVREAAFYASESFSKAVTKAAKGKLDSIAAREKIKNTRKGTL